MATSESNQSGVLGRLRDTSRPVIVFGPSSDDARVTKQSHSWAGPLPEAGVKDRDLVVVEVHGSEGGRVAGASMSPAEAAELRSSFKIAADEFAVILVGRDGEEKVRWSEPVAAQEVFGKVDAMPMRQQEVKVKGGGSE